MTGSPETPESSAEAHDALTQYAGDLEREVAHLRTLVDETQEELRLREMQVLALFTFWDPFGVGNPSGRPGP